MLQAAYDVIMTAVDAVGGRYVMIECHEKEKLMQFYAVNGFEEISHIADGKCPMVQMIRKIANAWQKIMTFLINFLIIIADWEMPCYT